MIMQVLQNFHKNIKNQLEVTEPIFYVCRKMPEDIKTDTFQNFCKDRTQRTTLYSKVIPKEGNERLNKPNTELSVELK